MQMKYYVYGVSVSARAHLIRPAESWFIFLLGMKSVTILEAIFPFRFACGIFFIYYSYFSFFFSLECVWLFPMGINARQWLFLSLSRVALLPFFPSVFKYAPICIWLKWHSFYWYYIYLSIHNNKATNNTLFHLVCSRLPGTFALVSIPFSLFSECVCVCVFHYTHSIELTNWIIYFLNVTRLQWYLYADYLTHRQFTYHFFPFFSVAKRKRDSTATLSHNASSLFKAIKRHKNGEWEQTKKTHRKKTSRYEIIKCKNANGRIRHIVRALALALTSQ